MSEESSCLFQECRSDVQVAAEQALMRGENCISECVDRLYPIVICVDP